MDRLEQLKKHMSASPENLLDTYRKLSNIDKKFID